MRIRKRIPPPSDLQLNKSAMVQLNIKNESLPSDLPNLNHPQPSDQPPVVTGVKPTTTSRWVLFGGNSNQDNYLKNKKEVEDDEKLWREKKESYGSRNDNDNKKELSFMSSPKLGSLPPQLSSSSDLDGRWCEEDHKVIPLKKRSRDNYHHHDHQQNGSNSNTMKSKTNKKCPPENGKEEQEHDHRRIDNNTNIDREVGHRVVVTNKKSKRGSVILEGSRCSRVNGRGWRCCQQTLVGYSLCEHHLGKGRLRSMNSVRNSTNKKKEEEEVKEEKPLINDHEYHDIYDDDEGDKKKKKKKTKKIGMVKARSLSSLLGQTNNVVATMVADNNDNKNG